MASSANKRLVHDVSRRCVAPVGFDVRRRNLAFAQERLDLARCSLEVPAGWSSQVEGDR